VRLLALVAVNSPLVQPMVPDKLWRAPRSSLSSRESVPRDCSEHGRVANWADREPGAARDQHNALTS
jgi:hypothetical protein